ncbi:MFS transporter [Phytomonospora sp. NPDC050363]|uniref:MFS transporter n=1 Tax=Phytomonospora sp. NPDC050363 TaxID=3155642 RepID=UPI0033E051D9
MIGRLLAPYKAIAHSRALLLTFICLVISGVSISGYMVTLPIYASQVIGARPAEVGAYFATISLTAIPITLVVGKYSDRLASRRFLLTVVSIWVGLGFAVISLTGTFLQLLCVGLAFVSFQHIVNGQMLALAREICVLSGKEATSLLANLRSGYSLGYVLGPVVLGAAIAVVDIHAVFIGFGVLYTVPIVVSMALIGGGRRATTAATAHRSAPRLDRPLRLYLLGGGLALVLSMPIIKTAYLGLFVVDELNRPMNQMVLVFSVSPALELILMPLCALAAAQWGSRTVVLWGCVAAVASLAGTWLAEELWQIVAIQALDALVLASVVAVGVGLVQEMASNALGYATSVFQVSRISGHLIGSSAAGLVAGAVGLRCSFGVAAIWVASGAILVWASTRSPVAARQDATVKA